MEWLVGALVVLGVLAIVARFVARDASGQLRLPRIVDDSIGMWVLRRLTGRTPRNRPPDDDPVVPDPAALTVHDLVRRLQGDEHELAPIPTRVRRYVSSGDGAGALPLAPQNALDRNVGRAEEKTTGAVRRPSRATPRRRGALVTAFVATGVAAVGVLAVGLVSSALMRPPANDGGVGGVAGDGQPTPGFLGSVLAVLPSDRWSPDPTPSTEPSAAPTPAVSSSASAAASRSPTPAPLPPVAVIGCGAVSGSSVQCDGSASQRAVTFTFDFGEGTVLTGSDSIRSLTYDLPGTYHVILTVTDSLGRVDTDSVTVTIP